VVQPLGAVALVVTAVLNSRATGKRLDLKAKRAVALCIGGVGLFVIFAAVFAKETPIRTPELITILVILAAVLALLGGLFLYFRRHVQAIFYIISAGVLYGFVATLAKVVINRLTTGDFDVLTAVCIVALVAATLLGAYFVQTAYSSGPPDLVIAGLTVVDPLVAVCIGVTVLGEAADAPLYAGVAFLVAGAVAVAGVFQLAKHHPHAS
jgi:drug/metabolite transporter (DMT)-like permease